MSYRIPCTVDTDISNWRHCCQMNFPQRMLTSGFARRWSPHRTLGRCIPLRQFSEDPTLAWARTHPEQAQLCLLPPPWDVMACDHAYRGDLSTCMEGYLCWRKWPNVWNGQTEGGSDEILRDLTLRLSSHVLSAPLTLAHFLAQDTIPANTRVACVGARAESTIPFDLWKEFLLYTTAMSTKTGATYSIDFVGPDILAWPGKTPDRNVMIENGSSLVLRWLYRGLFHDLLSSVDIQASKWDVLVFYNPGFGHPHLSGDWKPTLDHIIALQHPMLLTAHSEVDAQRDTDVLQNNFGLNVEYRENPFASQISYQDPFDKNHCVRPNHYVAWIGRRG